MAVKIVENPSTKRDVVSSTRPRCRRRSSRLISAREIPETNDR